MAKEKKEKGSVSSLERAKSLKELIVRQIESIDLDVKDYTQSKSNVSQIFKINAGLRAAQFSGERDLGITVSSSKNIKEVIEVLNKASEVMDYLLNQTAYLTKRGETDEAIKMIQEQAKLQKELDTMVESVENIVVGYLEKGYARRTTINEFNEAKNVKKIEAAIELYKSGKKLSEVAESTSLPIEMLVEKCGPFRVAFLEANKKEIEKLFFKDQDMKQIADLYEVKIKHLRAALSHWALTDLRLAKLLESQKPSPAEAEIAEPAISAEVTA